MRGLQTGLHWCESVAPSSVTQEQRGVRRGRRGMLKAQGVMVISGVELQRTVRGRWRMVGTGSLVCSQREALFLQGSLLSAAPPQPNPPHFTIPSHSHILLQGKEESAPTAASNPVTQRRLSHIYSRHTHTHTYCRHTQTLTQTVDKQKLWTHWQVQTKGLTCTSNSVLK